MGIPRNVKKQAKEAREIQEALNTDPGKTAPIEKPPEAQEQNLDQNKPVEKEDKNLDQPKISAVGEELKVDDNDWEKRYKGLQSRYNREVPELRGKLETTESALDDMKREISDMKTSFQEAEPKPKAQELVFTDEEREQFGDGWIDMMTKVAESSHGDLVRQVGELQTQLADVKQGVTSVRETVVINNERSFRAALSRKVKAETGRDWLDINAEDSFHNFLAEKVPYTQSEKQEYLVQAHKNFDVEAAAKFFIDYAGPSSSKNELSPPNKGLKVPEELITPEVAGGNMPPEAEERVYTTDEVDQFYADKRRGAYKGKEKEARAIETDILAAGREGRIVNKRAYAHA